MCCDLFHRTRSGLETAQNRGRPDLLLMPRQLNGLHQKTTESGLQFPPKKPAVRKPLTFGPVYLLTDSELKPKLG